MSVSGSANTCRRMDGCLTGGGNSDLFSTPRMSDSAMSRSKGWPTGKLHPSGCQLHRWKQMAGGLLYPTWVCWGERTIFPQRASKESGIAEWCNNMKKWWCSLWPFRGVLSNPAHNQGALWSGKELHRCLTPPHDRGNLIDLKMLDMARKDPVTPAPAERVLSLRLRVEETIGISVPNELPTSQPEEAAQSGDLALVQRRRPLAPLGLPFHEWTSQTHPI